VAEKIAAKPVTVLITGDSGTGKEVLARYIHARSDRKTSPFVAVNLPAIPANLVESELFGHERGAFTGADKQKLGKFELANGGTLFLDEIGDLALDLQSKILRALQEHEIERWAGETHPAGPPRDLRDQPRPGTAGAGGKVPRGPVLAPESRAHRAAAAAGTARGHPRPGAALPRPHRRRARADAADALGGRAAAARSISLAGNIRELENIMARMAVVCDSELIEESDLPYDFALTASATPEAESEVQSLDAAILAFEKSFLRKALKRNQWNRKKTAEQLQIGYSTLKAKLKTYGIVAGADGDED